MLCFKGTIAPGLNTFIKVLSISRPGNELPTTHVITNKEETYDGNKQSQFPSNLTKKPFKNNFYFL